jgi:glycosyltransferase involved in cell wall biosynthesis
MNIGFVSTRLAGLDGVSLEVTKLARSFEAMGHTCFYCAGELDDRGEGRLVPEMHFTHPDAVALHDLAFSTPTPPPDLYPRIYAAADYLRAELAAFVHDFNIDLIISQNSNAIPMNIALGVAITELARRTRIKVLCHNHDFYWERDRFIINCIQDILDDAFPPRLPTVRHMTINNMMQRRLYAFKGTPSVYLPNVFDFANPPSPPDDYALSFRSEVGLSDNDIIILQPTRIIRRKGIEKAIELVRKLDDDRLILLLTHKEGDEAGEYGAWLREEAARSGIRYKFVDEYVDEVRAERDGHRVYSLWDVYPHADFITYPSTYEGFGNALLETAYFRKPFIVHTYPMYLSDIRPAGIRAVEFHHDITDSVLNDVRQLIDNPHLREEIVEHNYKVGLKHFSYAVLDQKLKKAIATFDDE